MNDEITSKGRKDMILGNLIKEEKIDEVVDEEILNRQVKKRRTQEKKIGYIIKKVNEWRKLYNGEVKDINGKFMRCSLEEAAQKVGFSKKSLQDYLL